MQFQVPQFIDVEDKVIGPFTLKQFLYIAGGALVLFLLFKIVKLFAFIILAIPIITITIALAFIKVHNKPFISIMKDFFGFLKKPDFYVWKKSGIKTKAEKEKAPEIIKVIPSQKRGKLKKKERLQDINWKINVEK